jgi:flagellin-like protein
MFMEKRGLSPVIATILLVAISLVLAVIIFLWAISFIGESVEKQGQKIELLCDDVNFDVEAIKSDGKIYIVNRGTVSLYGVEIREKSSIGSIEQVETFSGTASVLNGETRDIKLPSVLNIGDDIVVLPILLGETEEFKRPFTCDRSYGVETRVK